MFAAVFQNKLINSTRIRVCDTDYIAVVAYAHADGCIIPGKVSTLLLKNVFMTSTQKVIITVIISLSI